MATPSVLTTVCFVGIVVVVLLLVLYGATRTRVSVPALVAMVAVYLAVPAAMAKMGVLDRYDPLPAPALLLVLVVSLLTLVMMLSPVGGRWARVIPLGAVVALQAFRIPVEWVLYRLHVEGVIPVQMTFAGRNFDVITGIAGLVLGVWLLSGRSVRRGVLWVWNVLGLALLINIVAIAALSTPVPFRRFTEGPPNLLPGTFPYVWLPTFLVQVAWASHLLVFRKLRLGAGLVQGDDAREPSAMSANLAPLRD
jgi:hypothetical protein